MATTLNENPGVTRFIISFVLIAFTVGCTTMRPVYGTDETSYSAQIEVGDKIEVTRNDLTTLKFKVTDLSNDGISGDDTFVAYSDIQTVQTVHSNAGAIIGIIAISALVVVLAAAGGGGPTFSGFSLQ